MKKPKLKCEWVGLKVRTLAPLETNGGAVIAPGTLMEVWGNYGGLKLKQLELCPHCKCGQWHRITGVPESEVEIVEV